MPFACAKTLSKKTIAQKFSDAPFGKTAHKHLRLLTITFGRMGLFKNNIFVELIEF